MPLASSFTAEVEAERWCTEGIESVEFGFDDVDLLDALSGGDVPGVEDDSRVPDDHCEIKDKTLFDASPKEQGVSNKIASPNEK